MPELRPDLDLTRMLQAILTRVRDQEGYAIKTKLVKYLYLLDLAAYRRTGRLLTGFTWIFHHYGPWTREFEDLYEQAAHAGAIRVRPGTRPDLETEFIEPTARVELGDVIADPVLEIEARHIIDAWADRRLGEMLDHVYFETEPMAAAERGDPLDFTTVVHARTPSPPWRATTGDRGATERLRRRLAAQHPDRPPTAVPRVTPPRYDAEYFEALDAIAREDDE
jgi:hypothetical protein